MVNVNTCIELCCGLLWMFHIRLIYKMKYLLVNDSQGRRLLWSRVLVRCRPGNQMNWKCQHKCQHWMWAIHPVCVSQDIFTLLFCIKCFLSWCPLCWDHMISPIHNSHGETNTTFQCSVMKTFLFTLVRLTLDIQCKFWILKQKQLRLTCVGCPI